jgi:cytochrome c oxidase assembly protein subunit 15
MQFSSPATISDGRVRAIAWANLIAQILIVETGALVRLTASGLGCPTWPLCTAESLVTTPEMGIHGAIEFGNRLLTFVLLVISVALVWVFWRSRTTRRDLWGMSIAVLAGIPLQAIVGGISVWTKLNPYVVGLHFVLSAVMAALSAIILIRVIDVDRVARFRDVSASSWIIAAFVKVTVLVGILTTGSGPHAGDATAPRNGLEPEFMQHLHSWPAYITVALVVIAIARSTGIARRWWIALLASFGVQITVGIVQSRLGLPVGFVAVHVLLALVTVAIATTAIYRNTTSGSIATARNNAVK